jgi:Mg2+ and Co2+ transporter CorA
MLIEEIKQIDRKTRNMLTMYKIHNPKADVERLYVKRKEGRRGLVQVEAAYETETINIAEYLNKVQRRPVTSLSTLLKTMKAHSQI